MEIILKSIGDKGDYNNERIGFVALKKCQMKYFLVVKTKKTENGFRNKGDNFYWFLPQEVEENDKIVLYSKKGQNSIENNPDGTKTYFYYWGLNDSIFKSANDIVVLANINDWKLNKN